VIEVNLWAIGRFKKIWEKVGHVNVMSRPSEPFRAVRGLCFVVILENVLVSGSPKRTSTEKAKASARDRNTSIPS
jgi:hypothetical protein